MTIFEDFNTKLCIILIISSWILITLVATFWHSSHGQTKFLLFLLALPIWILIKIRGKEPAMD
jgi:hypothetical protein